MSESEKMTVARAVEILREHDKWLDVGAGRPPFGPRELGKAISTVCDALEWRPIEVAPLYDNILLEVAYDGTAALRTGIGVQKRGAWAVSTLVQYKDGEQRWVSHEVNPTHWRPLPEPPA